MTLDRRFAGSARPSYNGTPFRGGTGIGKGRATRGRVFSADAKDTLPSSFLAKPRAGPAGP